MDLTFSPDVLLLLAASAALAGFTDALAGGGGLITIPVLLLAQVPPVAAVATNKLQGTCGTLTASLTLMRKGEVCLAAIAPDLPFALLGAMAGALAIQHVDPHMVDIAIPLTLAAIALYFLLAPTAGAVRRETRVPTVVTRAGIIPAIGFYDGFLGPGAGSFFALMGVALRGQTLVGATASAKALNFVTNAASLAVFIASGKVVWLVGGVMIFGQIGGAYLGSLAIVAGGARLIRPVIVVTCLAMIARYAWQKGWPV